MGGIVKAKREQIRAWTLDLGVLAGAAVFVCGLYLVSHALAAIVGGALLAVGCWLLGYESPRHGGSF